MPMNWQTVQYPLAAGLDTKTDPRAMLPPSLAVAKNVEFDEVGGLRLRKPYETLGGALTNVRKVVANGDELLAFTKDSLYTYDAANSTWKSRATYLAPKVTEQPVFIRNSEQDACDRAELSGVALYAWEETAGATTVVKAAAIDTSTGAVILAPTTVTDGVTGLIARPRIVALATRFMLFGLDAAGDLYVVRVDPASLSLTIESAPTAVFTGINDYYDVTSSGGVAYAACRRAVTTSYDVASITSSAVVAVTNKVRDCNGPIAISAAPNGTHLQIIRANAANIQGDYLSIAGPFTDVYTGQAVGTASGTVNQIAAAHRSTTDSGEYRCYAFWSSAQATNSSDWTSKYNYVDTGNNLGTEANFVRRLGVASRAFDHDGRVYVWMAFAGTSSFSGGGTAGFRSQLQNTYFVYRDDALLVAKAAMHRAGGFSVNTGHLPNVQSLGSNTYGWCGVERRIIPVGEKQKSYSARSPIDIKLELDSNDARRCVRLGETLYIAGGEIRQWDGTSLTEVGFHIFPWSFGAIELASAGLVDDGTYALKITWRWDNARDDRDRSTTATVGTVEITAGPNSIQIPSWIPLYVTHKTDPAIACEVWRTLVNPTTEAPFYLTTGQDPATVTGTNAYVANITTSASLASFEDALADSSVDDLEINPENGGLLENLAPPAASIIAASQDRIFLGGVAGDPHRIWYSKLRGQNEVAAFHDALTIDIPPHGGDMTAVAFLDETLICFRETAIYALPGDGFDNAGGGINYGPARRMSADVGAVNAESVAATPNGLIFKSSKGWYMLGRGGNVEYIGGAVASFDADTVVAVHTIEKQHQVRCMTSSARCLVWDYLVNQWAEWTIADAVSATIWGQRYVQCSSTAIRRELTTWTDVDYALDVETAWIKLADLQGAGSVRWISILGEYRSAHDLRVRIAYNYKESDLAGPEWLDDRYWTVSPTTVGGPLQLRHGPRIHKCQSIKIRLTAYEAGSTSDTPAGEALRLTGLGLEIGLKPGLFRRLPAAQKQ